MTSRIHVNDRLATSPIVTAIKTTVTAISYCYHKDSIVTHCFVIIRRMYGYIFRFEKGVIGGRMWRQENIFRFERGVLEAGCGGRRGGRK